jgi:hypothetical protein
MSMIGAMVVSVNGGKYMMSVVAQDGLKVRLVIELMSSTQAVVRW